jgi:hypothetical protein
VSLTQLVLAFCGGGCAENDVQTIRGADARLPSGISKDELRDALYSFNEFAITTIRQASNELDERLGSSRIRKTNLLWKIRMHHAFQTMLEIEDPVEAFVETWGLCVRLLAYLESGEGSTLYGEHQGIALEAARLNRGEIERIGRAFMTEDVFSETQSKVEAFAKAHPIRGMFSKLVVYAIETKAGEQNPFARVLTLPMAPFRAVEGVDRGAQAISRFRDTAERFTDIVEDFPESARWQLLLLLYDMGEMELVEAAMSNMTKFSQSSERLAEAAEKLPERLRKETSLLVEQIDAKQANLQVTLEKAEKSAAALERAAAKVGEAADSMQGVSKGIAETATAWEAAAESTTQLLEEYGKVAPPPDREEPSFKIEDYRQTAEATAMTAIELRGLVTELREMSEAGELSQYGSAARGLMNDVTWRLGGLVLTVFVLAALYRTVFAPLKHAGKKDHKG